MTGFHVVTVGWPKVLVEELCPEIAARGGVRFSHVAHPRHLAADGPAGTPDNSVHFFRERRTDALPPADAGLLASLERPGVPTIHNMILGDRVVCRLDYGEAQRYATFLAQRLLGLFARLSPSAVIGGFDALHGGLALAAARKLGIPWYALHFAPIPPGLACFVDRMSPAARVQLGARDPAELRALAETSLRGFEQRSIRAPAYVAPSRSPARALARLPARVAASLRVMRKGRDRSFVRFTDAPGRYNVAAALRQLRRSSGAHAALGRIETVATPDGAPYVLFGLHFQPESTIDVWAPFFSNQLWVIELLSRSIPASHRLLVKIHKSDVARYPHRILERMQSFPGVRLVRPFADTRDFIEKADLVVAIQGTIGLEASLLGRPVIMLGESPVRVFPGASTAGALADLPELVRAKLRERPPGREAIVDAYAAYLAPFLPGSRNYWRGRRSAADVDEYAGLFGALRRHLEAAA